jgi:hypothetical protein
MSLNFFESVEVDNEVVKGDVVDKGDQGDQVDLVDKGDVVDKGDQGDQVDLVDKGDVVDKRDIDNEVVDKGDLESSPTWFLEGVGSFDGDAKVDDLIWRNYATGQNVIWFMEDSSYQGFAVVNFDVPDTNWQIEGVGSFDGDAKVDDLIWRNYATGQNVIWYVEGNSYQGASFIPSVEIV